MQREVLVKVTNIIWDTELGYQPDGGLLTEAEIELTLEEGYAEEELVDGIEAELCSQCEFFPIDFAYDVVYDCKIEEEA